MCVYRIKSGKKTLNSRYSRRTKVGSIKKWLVNSKWKWVTDSENESANENEPKFWKWITKTKMGQGLENRSLIHKRSIRTSYILRADNLVVHFSSNCFSPSNNRNTTCFTRFYCTFPLDTTLLYISHSIVLFFFGTFFSCSVRWVGGQAPWVRSPLWSIINLASPNLKLTLTFQSFLFIFESQMIHFWLSIAFSVVFGRKSTPFIWQEEDAQ